MLLFLGVPLYNINSAKNNLILLIFLVHILPFISFSVSHSYFRKVSYKHHTLNF